jgi:hypothetical protein
MLIAADALSGVLAFVFGAGGVAKFTRAKRQVDTATRLRIPWRRYRLIGIPELAASVGLLLGFALMPLGAAAAIGLVVLMAGALLARIRVRDSAAFLVGDAVFLAAAAATAVLRLA